MARNLLLWDSATERMKRSSFLEEDVGGFTEVIYAVAADTTEFPAPSGAAITEGNIVEFVRNGQGLFEGTTDDFQRDVDNNKVVSNYAIPSGSKVKLRVYQG